MAVGGQGDEQGRGEGRRRPRWRRRVLAALGVALVLLAVYGVAVEPRLVLDVDEEPGPVPRLPEAWDGARVAWLSDLQVGMWLDNVGMARRAVERAVEAEPAVALLGGDFVYGEGDTTDDVTTAVDVVRPLVEAGIPTYAVLGNHDYDAGAAEELTAALEAAGVAVLENEAVALPAPGGATGRADLHLVGIGPTLPGRARPGAALADVPAGAPRIVMMHNPETFPALPPSSAPLAVAGHTHGGQLRVPALAEWSFLDLVQGHEVHADGWIDGYGAEGNRLYVNRGIGMSLVPARVNCPPHLTLFALTRAS